MTAIPAHRIEGLVAWRAILMLGGLVLHATMGIDDHPVVAAVNIVSGSFRMGAFFMLSGLMTGLALARYPDRRALWFERRLMALSLPTLVGLAVICPIVRLQLALLDGGRLPALSVYHLWFMVALMDYSGLAWIAWRLDRATGLLTRIAARPLPHWLGQPLLLVAVGTAAFVPMVATAALTGGRSSDDTTLFRQLPLVIGYAPLFLLGAACGGMPALRATLLGGTAVPVAILTIAAAAHGAAGMGWLPIAGDTATSLLMMAGAAWCPGAATVLILRSAERIRCVPAILCRLSDASLTMYLIHYPLMLAIRILIAPLAPAPWQSFAMLLIGGGSLAYWVHTRMVAPSSWMALMLNGRLQPARPTG